MQNICLFVLAVAPSTLQYLICAQPYWTTPDKTIKIHCTYLEESIWLIYDLHIVSYIANQTALIQNGLIVLIPNLSMFHHHMHLHPLLPWSHSWQPWMMTSTHLPSSLFVQYLPSTCPEVHQLLCHHNGLLRPPYPIKKQYIIRNS